MKKLFIFSLVIILFFSTLLSADNVSILDSGSLNAKTTYVPGELLVKYKTQSRTSASAFYKTNWNISTIRTFKSIGCQHVKLPQGMTVEQAMDMYRNDPNVEYAEPNYIYHATLTPNDPSIGELWGLHNTGQPVNGASGTPDADIDATEAWDMVTGSDTVIIAVIDSGVKWDHEDLATNIWINSTENTGTGGVDDDSNGYVDDIRGWDFVDDDNDPMDYNGHGTHVAGTIAAVGQEIGPSVGVTGVCWRAKIMPIRGLDAAGSGTTDNLISAILYANANGADIINNSWGGTTPPGQALKNAIDASSAVVVCAAGNSNVNTDTTPHYPSSYTSTNIISVAATDQNDLKADFSNWGATSVDVGAPGTNIYSTIIARHDVFSDDFSGGLGNWVTGGTSSWGIESNYLTESPSGNYVDNTDSWIRTINPISLADETGLRLEFQLRGISESGYDILYIDTSSNGTSWTNIEYLSGSTNGYWFPMEYDISTYAGGNFYIRFRFTSDVSYNFDGWHIDDVKVTAYTPATHNSYEYFSGTSMAAPIVSGIAGLIKAHSPGLTNIQIKSAIEANVDPLGSLSGRVATGGRVNAGNIFPAAPTFLSATAFSGTRIDLTWADNSFNEDGFRIERRTVAGTWSLIDTVTSNTTIYSNTGVSELTIYRYRVCAYNSVVNSPYSNEDTAITLFEAPSNLNASTFTDTEIDLTWTDNSNIETGFRIERATVSGGPFALDANVGATITTYRSSSLTESTQYFYRVQAYNVGNNSAFSTEANATTLAADAPSGLIATAVSSSRINLEWNDSPSEDEFRIERKEGVGGTYAVIGTVEQDITEYSDTGLSTSTEYYYRVISYLSGTLLDPSNEANATTQAAVPPDNGGGGGGSCFISTAALNF